MICMSCQTQIPPEWQAAISQNSCPKCGEAIMSSHVKVVADNLKNVVGDLISLGEEQMDLLLDTYGLQRQGVSSPKQTSSQSDESLPPNFKQAANPVQEWLKRSKAPHLANRQEKLKDIVDRVNASSDEDFAPEAWEQEEGAPTEPALTAKQILANNSLMQPGQAAPPSPEEQQQLAQAWGQEEVVDPDLHPALQRDRLNRLEKSRGVANGGGQGGFRRSG